MALDSQLYNLRDLSLDLQTLLRSHFPQSAPIQVFCMQMSHKLLVLVQHSARVMPDEQAVERVLQTTLERNPPSSIHRWLMETDRPQMELFLRVTGDNQVYASGIFDLHPDRRSLHWPPIPPLIPAPTAPESLITPSEQLPEPATSFDDERSPNPDPDIATDPIDESVLDAFNATGWIAETDPGSEPDAIAADPVSPLETLNPLDSSSTANGAIAPLETEFDSPQNHEDETNITESWTETEDVEVTPETTAEEPILSHDFADPLIEEAIAPLETAPSETEIDSPQITNETDADITFPDVSEIGPEGLAESEATVEATQDESSTEESVNIMGDRASDRPTEDQPFLTEISEESEDSDPEPTHDTAIVPISSSVAESDDASTVTDDPNHEPVAALPSGEEPNHPPRRWGRKRWLVAGTVGAVAIAGGVYALTRPCVLGACQNLVEAQNLDAQASELIQSPQSAQDAVDAYDQWIDASYLLQQIPPWSPSYAQAQRLLTIYETRIGVLDNVVQAQRQAYTAAVKSQNPPHPIDVWREVRVLWQDAIALLQDVPEESSVYPLAQTKLQEYESNLAAIDRRIETERSAQAKIQSAREAATVAEAREQVANSLEEWQQTHGTWQTSIALLKQVPPNTMSHAEARQLLEIYQLKMNAARDRLQQETIAQSAYQQALTLADEAASYENDRQWSQAVVSWRDALNQAQQVPQNTTYYEQAQPLIESYTQSLSSANEKLQLAVARQDAETQLANLCATSQQCTFVALSDRFQVRVTQESLGRGSFPLPGANQPIAEPFNNLLRSVADVGRQAQVKIDVFNVDGTLFGTYTPDVNGYVPPSNSSTPEPYRF